jgi:hypothetical protein
LPLRNNPEDYPAADATRLKLTAALIAADLGSAEKLAMRAERQWPFGIPTVGAAGETANRP